MSRPIRTLLITGSPGQTSNARKEIGSGKGTLSNKLKHRFPLVAISSGDILRSHVHRETELGLQVQSILESGGFVDDTIMATLIADDMRRMEEVHLLLDGFPRTVAQAQLFQSYMKDVKRSLDMVVHLDVPEDVIIKRLEDRWIHEPSGRTYNYQFNPPRVHGKDDVSGEDLVRRADDDIDIFRERIKQYRASTLPLLDFYDKLKVLHSFKGETSKQLFPQIESEMKKLFE
ncbi:hypothetical protein HDU76_000920 [Blyttiomyces sp. JEL0837]|nr:hypothetical protein HDU76_000920 [Blyttiomyces sp. JEL0837]